MTSLLDEPIEFSATTTYRDILAAQKNVAKSQPRRPLWRRRAVIIPGGALVGLAIAMLTDNDDPIEVFKSLVTKQMGGVALVFIALLAVFLLGVGAMTRAYTRILQRSIGMRSRRRHPAVDAGDPALPMTRTYRFDETGMTTRTAYDELWEGWARINGLDETADLMIVRVGGGTVAYPFPKRQLEPELRERLQRYVDARSSSKWPF